MKQTSLSAGAVIYRRREETLEYLLLRAFKYWDFPKGAVEPGEDPWAAALREVEEETGLKELISPCGMIYFETKPYGKGKVARYYILKAAADAKISILPNPLTGIIEHHEYRWISFEGARNLLVPRIQEVIDWAQELIVKQD